VAHNVAELLIKLTNIEKIEISFKWNLIENDPDDNKFVDAAIAGRVKYVVSNDSDYKVLSKIEFPHVDVIHIDEFLKILAQHK